jgi:hypothetical protein
MVSPIAASKNRIHAPEFSERKLLASFPKRADCVIAAIVANRS